ncbi:MAG: HdeD family acid-resistance protein [Actinomycetota bacterium]|nr:HdeD family acid-resistance protein [Actinomycetota bacterium]
MEQRTLSDAGDMLAELGRSWWVVLVWGLVTLVAGIGTIVWPGRTILVIAVLVGIQFFVSGVVRLIGAFALEGEGHRAWDVIVGLGSVVVGILCLKDVFQTIAALTLIIGIMWVVQGVAEFFVGVAGLTRHRGLTILMGILGFVAGVVVLTYPITSVLALAWVLGVWLTAYGIMQIAAAFAVRRLTTAVLPPLT